ncbi:MAG: 2Fe-2S iron-sulfur cluster-binding protein [Acidobacteriota bacterium]
MPKLTIDGRPVEVAEKTNLIEAAHLAGVEIPYFCYHPYLSVVGQCRICMVEIEGQPRLAIACATPAAEGMVVKSETSPRVKEAREAVMEFLLANHPLDCPVCDQAGECLLQDHAMSEQGGQFTTHMVEARRTFPGFERRLLGPHIVQNQNRCIHCSRCIRLTQEISETAQLTFKSRGNHAYIDTFDSRPFDDPHSACAADVCPVGALTARELRFRKRAWKLRSTPSVCAGCSIGCNLWIDHHERVVYRLTPRENPSINATWLCDHGRYLAESLNLQHFLHPQRRAGGQLARVTWVGAVTALGLELGAARTIRVVASANLANESLYAARELFGRRLKGEIVVPVLSGDARRMKNGKNEWLSSADAHPNSEGARRLGLKLVDAGGLARFLYGAADLTIILDPLAHPFLASDEALQLLGVGATAAFVRTDHPLAGVASWLLPTPSLACQEGTFIAGSGAVQRFSAAFAPAGEARTHLQIFGLLARELGMSELDFPDPGQAFAVMSEREQAFSGLTWAALGAAGEEETLRERQHVG